MTAPGPQARTYDKSPREGYCEGVGLSISCEQACLNHIVHPTQYRINFRNARAWHLIEVGAHPADRHVRMSISNAESSHMGPSADMHARTSGDEATGKTGVKYVKCKSANTVRATLLETSWAFATCRPKMERTIHPGSTTTESAGPP